MKEQNNGDHKKSFVEYEVEYINKILKEIVRNEAKTQESLCKVLLCVLLIIYDDLFTKPISEQHPAFINSRCCSKSNKNFKNNMKVCIGFGSCNDSVKSDVLPQIHDSVMNIREVLDKAYYDGVYTLSTSDIDCIKNIVYSIPFMDVLGLFVSVAQNENKEKALHLCNIARHLFPVCVVLDHFRINIDISTLQLIVVLSFYLRGTLLYHEELEKIILPSKFSLKIVENGEEVVSKEKILDTITELVRNTEQFAEQFTSEDVIYIFNSLLTNTYDDSCKSNKQMKLWDKLTNHDYSNNYDGLHLNYFLHIIGFLIKCGIYKNEPKSIVGYMFSGYTDNQLKTLRVYISKGPSIVGAEFGLMISELVDTIKRKKGVL